jgi:hypothetical protein
VTDTDTYRALANLREDLSTARHAIVELDDALTALRAEHAAFRQHAGANLASLNELVTELTAEVAKDPDFTSMVVGLLRALTFNLGGYQFRGETRPGDWDPDAEYLRLAGETEADKPLQPAETTGPAAAFLAEAKRIADGLQFACRLPDKKPDFTAGGGPAAETYWEYFHPARIVSLLAAVEAATRLHSKWEIREDDGEGALERLICRHCCAADGGGQTEGCADEHAAGNCWPCPTYRAITAELAKGPGDAR